MRAARQSAIQVVPSLLLALAIGGAAAEPPGPWESQGAILLADTIVRGAVMDFESIPEDGHREESRARLKVRVTEVLNDESGTVKEGMILNVLVPCATGVPAEPPSISGQFKQGADLLAALTVSSDRREYTGSTEWPHLSFQSANQSRQDQIKALLRANPYSKSKALQAAAVKFGVLKETLRISIIGGRVRGSQLHYTKDATDRESSLVWYVRQPGARSNTLYLDARTGQALELLKNLP